MLFSVLFLIFPSPSYSQSRPPIFVICPALSCWIGNDAFVSRLLAVSIQLCDCGVKLDGVNPGDALTHWLPYRS